MNNITLYALKLHNANHYRLLSQAAAAFSATIAQRLEGMAEQDLKHAEMLYAAALEGNEAVGPVDFNAFEIDFERDPSDYITDIIDEVIDTESYQERIYKEYGMEGLQNIAWYRVYDCKLFRKYIEDGSIFGDSLRVADFTCTTCGYIHRVTSGEHKYMPETCPLCNSERSAFIRRPSHGGW